MLTTQPHASQTSRTILSVPSPAASRWRSQIGTAARWFLAWGVALGLTVSLVAAILRPPTAHLIDLAAYLLAGGAISLVMAVGLHVATRTGRFSGVRARFAVPVVLTAVVIATNVLIVARMMFLAQPDTVLVLTILVFGVVLAVTLATSLAEVTISSLRRLEASARSMAAGDYGVRVPEGDVGDGAEIARVGRWFNQMAARVEEAFDRQRRAEYERHQIVAALSHDLRTPVASIRAMVEAITDGVVSEQETIDRYHRCIGGEVRHLSALIDDLFELARLEALPSGATALRCEVVALGDVISDTLEAMYEQAHAQGVHLSGSIESALPPVTVDVRQIHRVLTNLVQNALAHTRPGGHVALRAARVHDAEHADTQRVVVQVVDDGDGIAAADLPHVFEPSFRGERSRRRDVAAGHLDAHRPESRATGAGLGLAIARGVVEAHGGTIRAESPLSPASAALLAESAAPDELAGSGTCLTVTLPL